MIAATLVAGCSHSTPAVSTPSGTPPAQPSVDGDTGLEPGIPEPPLLAIRLKLYLDKPNPSASDAERLTLVVSNVSHQTISFKLYEGQRPENLAIITDNADITDLCIWNAEPPNTTATIPPGSSRSFHPLDPRIGFLLGRYPNRQGGGLGQAHNISLHVHAKWSSDDSNSITSNDVVFHIQ